MKTDSSVSITISAITKLFIKYGRQNNVTLVFNSGWNLISAPIFKPDMNKDTYYPGNESNAFKYNSTGGYLVENTFTPGRGYWLKFSDSATYNIQGLNYRKKIDVQYGWNMVGLFDFPVEVTNIQTKPPGIISSNFFEYNSGYSVATMLKPGKGYWVKSNSIGKIVLDPSILVKEIVGAQSSLYDHFGKMKIEDASGNEMTLYISEDTLSCELPPPPPQGIFDARYMTGNLVENISRESKQIIISSATYPVTISVEGIEIILSDIITGKIVNEILRSGERLVLSNPNINILKISGKFESVIPDRYKLFQNYPNPFNPSTVIEFGIPEDTKNVKLTIYNALGEKIAELINSSLEAGYYKYSWNASNYASGLYIYELKTEKFHSIKKMMLVK